MIMKTLTLIACAIFTFLQPLHTSLIFIGILVSFDFITGCIKGIMNKDFDSDKAVRKLFVSLAYFICLIVAKAFEDYFKIDDQLAVKAVTGIIALSELQSLRENVKVITGVDILKDLGNIIRPKKKG